jgi:ABC-2 type transport system permease protein
VTTGDHRADGGEPSMPAMPDVPDSRSWARAFGDLRQGWRQRSLWGYLGWQDIKQRYRRSVLGPLWISISMGVIATAMGILYGALFGEPIETFLPYVATGLLIWNVINGCILEGSEVFIANEGLIRFLPAPISLHVYRLLWRQTLFFLHNLVIWALLVIIFPQPLSASVLLAVPAFLLLILNGGWLTIVWSYERLKSNPLSAYIELNPVMHFVEIVRQPLLGEPIVWRHWAVVGVITVIGCGVALVCMRNYRSRVAYWV